MRPLSLLLAYAYQAVRRSTWFTSLLFKLDASRKAGASKLASSPHAVCARGRRMEPATWTCSVCAATNAAVMEYCDACFSPACWSKRPVVGVPHACATNQAAPAGQSAVLQPPAADATPPINRAMPQGRISPRNAQRHPSRSISTAASQSSSGQQDADHAGTVSANESRANSAAQAAAAGKFLAASVAAPDFHAIDLVPPQTLPSDTWLLNSLASGVWAPSANPQGLHVSFQQLFDAKLLKPASQSAAPPAETATHCLLSSFGMDRDWLARAIPAGCHNFFVDDYDAETENPGSHTDKDGTVVHRPPLLRHVLPNYAKPAASPEAASRSAGRTAVGGMYSSMHAKIVMVRFSHRSENEVSRTRANSDDAMQAAPPARVRVAVVSANAFWQDWTLMHQCVWMQDFIPSAGRSRSPIINPDKSSAVGHSRVYLTPLLGDFRAYLNDFMDSLAVPRETKNLFLHPAVNFHGAQADLLASVPGIHGQYGSAVPRITSHGASNAARAGTKRPRSAAVPSTTTPSSPKDLIPPELHDEMRRRTGSPSISAPVCRWGHMRLRFLRAYQAAAEARLLEAIGNDVACPPAHVEPESAPTIVIQPSSLGQLFPSFLTQLYASALGCRTGDVPWVADATKAAAVVARSAASAAASKPAAKRASSKGGARSPSGGRHATEPIICVWPAKSTVKDSHYGGGHLCFSRQTWEMPSFPRGLFAHWRSRAPRSGVLPHSKLIMPLPNAHAEAVHMGGDDSDATVQQARNWCYAGSANASASAWGTLQLVDKPHGPQLRLAHYELGVLFPPVYELRASDAMELTRVLAQPLIAQLFSVSPDPPTAFPIAFEFPPVKYDFEAGDMPWCSENRSEED